jgi:putative oxidoreductase
MTNTSNTTGTTDRAGNADSVGGLRAAALSTVRIVVSFLFICHGAQKLFGAFGGSDGQGTPAPLGSWPRWWAGLIELVGGGLVLLGLFTIPAALLCAAEMAFAYFAVHQPLGLLPLQNKGEPAALYAWVFLLIAILGPGSFALDTVLKRLRAPHRLTG